MVPGGPAVDAKFVLNQDDLHIVDIEKIGSAAIGIEFLFVDLKSDAIRVVVAFGSIIDRAYDALTFRKFGRNCITNVRGERGNAALTWKVISEKSYLLDIGNLHGSVCDQLSRVCRMEMIRFCNLQIQSHGLAGPSRNPFRYPEIVSFVRY